jgi:hypothetical protein
MDWHRAGYLEGGLISGVYCSLNTILKFLILSLNYCLVLKTDRTVEHELGAFRLHSDSLLSCCLLGCVLSQLQLCLTQYSLRLFTLREASGWVQGVFESGVCVLCWDMGWGNWALVRVCILLNSLVLKGIWHDIEIKNHYDRERKGCAGCKRKDKAFVTTFWTRDSMFPFLTGN